MNYKKDFPIFKNKNLVYLDSSATSQKPKVVLDAISDYYENYNANVRRGLYPIAEKATEKVEEVRRKVAKFINAKSEKEIIFVRNTTEAINLVMYAFGKQHVKKGDKIATTILEHHSNFVPWQQLALEKEADFQVLDFDKTYNIAFKNLENTKLLAITHVSNVLGTILPLENIIKELKEENPQLKILVDAAQSVPHMSVDVQALGADFVAFSGHKMMAATGVGILYAKQELLDAMQPFLYGGEMIKEVGLERTIFADSPFKFEAGTPDIASIISLGSAIDYLESVGMETIQKHEKELMAYCIPQIEKIHNLTMYGPKTIDQRSGLISFTIEGIHPHDIAQILGDKNICIRSGHHCAMPLHKRLGIPATARASFYIYNDFSDIDALIEGIKHAKTIFEKKS